MKRKTISLYILLLMAFGYATAQETITVTSNNREISDNLDLQAVASIFGDSENLEDFENRLNDPNIQISNLDLNRDGYVDYLRVVELSEVYTHLIAIQAVIGKDLYQDVTTIEVERDRYQATTIQVVGDPYIYGPNYIIEPIYARRPVIIVWFWGPYYKPWHSPYYWSYYPHYFRPWHPCHPYVYRTNVHVHINVYNTYNYTNIRKSGMAVNMYHQVHRNDYGNRHPENSFANRNRGITNRSQLNHYGKSVSTNNYKKTRPARTIENGDLRTRETKVVSNGRTVASNGQTRFSTKEVSHYKPTSKKAGTANRVEKGPVNQKNNISYTQPQKQNRSAVNTNRNISQKADRNTNYERNSTRRNSVKPKSNSTQSVKQSRSAEARTEKAAPQPQSKQVKRSANVRSQPNRR